MAVLLQKGLNLLPLLSTCSTIELKFFLRVILFSTHTFYVYICDIHAVPRYIFLFKKQLNSQL